MTGGDWGDRQKHLVILVHGIRDHAEWMHELRPVLEESGFEVALTNYDWFDLVRFLLPAKQFRLWAIGRVTRQIDAAIVTRKPARVSYIAHSFGTFVIAHILEGEFRLNAHRIILCGSVLKNSFPFIKFLSRFDPPILNEVGTRDYWPAVAEGVTWGYGAIGTYGYRSEPVLDRVHNGAEHGFFLSQDFCNKYWVPFLRDGSIVPGDACVERRPWWLVPIRFAKWGILVVLVFALARWYCLKPLEGPNEELSSGFAPVGVYVADTLDRMQDACNDSCRFSCLTGRSCSVVQKKDQRLLRLTQCDAPPSVNFEKRDPTDTLRAIQATFPQCLDVTWHDAHTISVMVKQVREVQLKSGSWWLCECDDEETEGFMRHRPDRFEVEPNAREK